MLGQSYKNSGNSPTGSSLDFWRASSNTRNGNPQQTHYQQTQNPNPSLGSVNTARKLAESGAASHQAATSSRAAASLQQSLSRQPGSHSLSLAHRQSNINSNQRRGSNNNENKEDLDSSNVLYDDDFELEEETKQNY